MTLAIYATNVATMHIRRIEVIYIHVGRSSESRRQRR